MTTSYDSDDDPWIRDYDEDNYENEGGYKPVDLYGAYADDPYAYEKEATFGQNILKTFDDGGPCENAANFAESILTLRMMPQPQLNLMWRLIHAFKLDIKANWQGLLVMYMRMRKDIVDQYVNVEEISADQEEVQQQQEEIDEPVARAMGIYSEKKNAKEPDFTNDGRRYEKTGSEMAPWSDEVLDDYFAYLRKNVIYESISNVGYHDPLIIAKWLPQTWDVAKTLAREMPVDMSYYIPGDGLGIYSYFFRKRGMRVYSTEPSEVGDIALGLGLIDEKAPYDEALDDGAVVLVLANIPPEVEVTWKGPVIVWQQQPDRKIGLEIPGTGGRLMIRDLKLNMRVMLGEPTRHAIERTRQWLVMRMKSGGYDTEQAYVADESMRYTAKLLGIRLIGRQKYKRLAKDNKIAVIGREKGQFDILRMQDRYLPNSTWRFQCNLKDTLYICGKRVVVQQFGTTLEVTDESLESVDVCDRRNYSGYEIADEDETGVFIERVRPHSGRLKAYLHGVLCEFVVVKCEKRIDCYYHHLRMDSRVGQRIVHSTYRVAKQQKNDIFDFYVAANAKIDE